VIKRIRTDSVTNMLQRLSEFTNAWFGKTGGGGLAGMLPTHTFIQHDGLIMSDTGGGGREVERIACGLLEGVVPLYARSCEECHDNITLENRFSLGFPGHRS
jgi:hypothetical protein